tara:strand:- start:665 stop:781 length:117 start_codon:yes stop_codon:yes gene_type:complete
MLDFHWNLDSFYCFYYWQVLVPKQERTRIRVASFYWKV